MVAEKRIGERDLMRLQPLPVWFIRLLLGDCTLVGLFRVHRRVDTNRIINRVNREDVKRLIRVGSAHRFKSLA
jgi:hypothetical protein